jgi:hypothetical protein
MPYKQNSPEWLEETICTCGCGHGSGEAHTDWCPWLKVERYTELAKAAADFLRSPSLHKVRVGRKMLTRKNVAEALSPTPAMR